MKLPKLFDNHKVRCTNVIDDVTYSGKEFHFKRHFECEVDDLTTGKTRPIIPYKNQWEKKITRVNLNKFDGEIDIRDNGTVWFGRFQAGPGKLAEPMKPFACHWGEGYGAILYCSTDPEPNWDIKYDFA